MRGATPPLPQYAFMEWCLVKMHRANFTFTFDQILICCQAIAALVVLERPL